MSKLLKRAMICQLLLHSGESLVGGGTVRTGGMEGRQIRGVF